jgi:hypothetical protein
LPIRRAGDFPKIFRERSFSKLFCRYVEVDYYEWLKDNFEAFFQHGALGWELTRGRVSP